jgi:acylphosphatase
MTTELVAFRAVVLGRVQGVGFRYSAAAVAAPLGIVGWARNRMDGSVELLAQGHPAALAQFEAWLGHGPRSARVDGLTVDPVAPDPSRRGFAVG